MGKIGIVQESFHSEVLDYLIEMMHDKKYDVTLYNDIDLYNNKFNYIRKYNNDSNKMKFEVKSLSKLILDVTQDVCEKYIIVSYDNIFHLEIFGEFRDKFIFMAHSKDHIDTFKKKQLNHFSLTELLSNKDYTLPLIKTPNTKAEIDLGKNDSIHHIEETLKTNNYIPIMTLGHFLEDNKDISFIKDLLKTNKVGIVIFTPVITEIIAKLIAEYKNQIFLANGLSTVEILYTIDQLKIEFLLFPPHPDSQFFKNSWSGSMAFAFDNDLTLILPETLSSVYGFQKCSVSYNRNDSNDLVNKIKCCDKVLLKQESQIFRNSTFKRNSVVFDKLLGIRNMNHNFDKELNETIQTILDNDKENFSSNEFIINSFINISNVIEFMNNNKNLSCVLINENYNIAVEQKEVLMYNFKDSKFKVFNNKIGNDITKCIKIDDILGSNVKILMLNNIDELLTAKNIITVSHPIIVLTESFDELLNSGYTLTQLTNYYVYH